MQMRTSTELARVKTELEQEVHGVRVCPHKRALHWQMPGHVY
jgi:hypothetical protein